MYFIVLIGILILLISVLVKDLFKKDEEECCGQSFLEPIFNVIFPPLERLLGIDHSKEDNI